MYDGREPKFASGAFGAVAPPPQRLGHACACSDKRAEVITAPYRYGITAARKTTCDRDRNVRGGAGGILVP